MALQGPYASLSGSQSLDKLQEVYMSELNYQRNYCDNKVNYDRQYYHHHPHEHYLINNHHHHQPPNYFHNNYNNGQNILQEVNVKNQEQQGNGQMFNTLPSRRSRREPEPPRSITPENIRYYVRGPQMPHMMPRQMHRHHAYEQQKLIQQQQHQPVIDVKNR